MENIPKIAGYTIERKLGEGGMAKVFFGVQEKLKRNVAIKILEPLLLKDEDFALRFLKEAETAANLNHPNIVTIYDVGQEQNHYYMVMEFLEGTLKDRIRSARNEVTLTRGYTPVSALKIVRQVASALDYAHKRGFIHRDIKPDNIMFRHDGTPVLVDFGIAKAMDATTKLTRTGMSVGTPHYMSPEQIRGQDIDGRADFYSLGIVLYEMLIGSVPFTASDYIAVAMKHLSEPVPMLPDYLSVYQPVIDKMLAKDKDARVQDGAELILLLDAYIENPPVAAAGKTPVAGPPNETVLELAQPVLARIAKPRKEKGRRRAIGVLFIIFILLTATLGYIVTRQKGKLPALDQAIETVSQKLGLATEKETPLEQTPIAGEPDTVLGDSAAKDVDVQSRTEVRLPDSVATANKKNIEPIGKKMDAGKQSLPDRKGNERTVEKPVEKNPSENIEPKPTGTMSDSTEDEPSLPETSPARVSPQVSNIPVINILNLFPGLIKEYSEELNRITVPGLPEGMLATGRVGFDFAIAPDGRLSVVRFNNRGLEVTPLLRRRKVVGLIYNAMNEIVLRGPKDRKGQSVQVENWRLSFKVGTFQGKIILTRI